MCTCIFGPLHGACNLFVVVVYLNQPRILGSAITVCVVMGRWVVCITDFSGQHQLGAELIN